MEDFYSAKKLVGSWKEIINETDDVKTMFHNDIDEETGFNFRSVMSG